MSWLLLIFGCLVPSKRHAIVLMATGVWVSACSEDPMQDFFIRQNIDRYQQLLETALDENERTKIVKLLAREETRLSKFTDPQSKKPATG
jgi:aromatic ring hydroxylase